MLFVIRTYIHMPLQFFFVFTLLC